ncbi:peptide-methionine (S)-S-oxide reductase [Leeuwenhoekiella sp. W20_SRS_FM14]|uniref:peptide-methionine (S)-S-oxide reductase n=1 Tax=Leeuwenhoekiella sp. W20_SRS_FM14 TaxID=3240270 RepID=UPI003F9BFAA8
MLKSISKIALGGGCHWCTEAVFQSLNGVLKVEQGYVASTGFYREYSEAVIVHFNPDIIPLAVLIEIHLYTHKSTSDHSFRTKYRSAVYYFSEYQEAIISQIIIDLQPLFKEQLITQILPIASFEASRESLHDYYLKDPDKPFCKRYIQPKLKLLKEKFSSRTSV